MLLDNYTDNITQFHGTMVNFDSNHNLYKFFILLINDFLKLSYHTNNRLTNTLTKLLTDKINDYNNTKE
jgi:hypothetical protein